MAPSQAPRKKDIGEGGSHEHTFTTRGRENLRRTEQDPNGRDSCSTESILRLPAGDHRRATQTPWMVRCIFHLFSGGYPRHPDSDAVNVHRSVAYETIAHVPGCPSPTTPAA